MSAAFTCHFPTSPPHPAPVPPVRAGSFQCTSHLFSLASSTGLCPPDALATVSYSSFQAPGHTPATLRLSHITKSLVPGTVRAQQASKDA